MKIGHYFGVLSRVFRRRKVVLAHIEHLIRYADASDAVASQIGKHPFLFENNDPSILHLSPGARIGQSNRFLVSNTSTFKGQAIIYLGKNAWTGSSVELNVLAHSKIVIKDYSSIQDFSKIIGNVIIEKYCLLAPCVFVSSGRHYIERQNAALIRTQDRERVQGMESIDDHSARVHIEEDCWIGYSSFIDRGIYVGRGAVVGANSVITQDVFPYSIVGSVNKKLGERLTFNPPHDLNSNNKDHRPYFYRGFSHLKEEFEADFGEGYILQGDGVLVMKQCALRTLIIEGFASTDSRFTIDVTINGSRKMVKDVNVSSGRFSCSMEFSGFIACSFVDDLVLRLKSTFNIYHLDLTPGGDVDQKVRFFDIRQLM